MRTTLAALLSATALLTGGCLDDTTPGEPTRTPHEDEPGFDCKHHGNKRCEPAHLST